MNTSGESITFSSLDEEEEDQLSSDTDSEGDNDDDDQHALLTAASIDAYFDQQGIRPVPIWQVSPVDRDNPAQAFAIFQENLFDPSLRLSFDQSTLSQDVFLDEDLVTVLRTDCDKLYLETGSTTTHQLPVTTQIGFIFDWFMEPLGSFYMIMGAATTKTMGAQIYGATLTITVGQYMGQPLELRFKAATKRDRLYLTTIKDRMLDPATWTNVLLQKMQELQPSHHQMLFEKTDRHGYYWVRFPALWVQAMRIVLLESVIGKSSIYKLQSVISTGNIIFGGQRVRSPSTLQNLFSSYIGGVNELNSLYTKVIVDFASTETARRLSLDQLVNWMLDENLVIKEPLPCKESESLLFSDPATGHVPFCDQVWKFSSYGGSGLLHNAASLDHLTNPYSRRDLFKTLKSHSKDGYMTSMAGTFDQVSGAVFSSGRCSEYALNTLQAAMSRGQRRMAILREKVYDSGYHLLDAGRIMSALKPLQSREMLGIMALPPKLVTASHVAKFQSMMNLSDADIDQHWSNMQYFLFQRPMATDSTSPTLAKPFQEVLSRAEIIFTGSTPLHPIIAHIPRLDDDDDNDDDNDAIIYNVPLAAKIPDQHGSEPKGMRHEIRFSVDPDHAGQQSGDTLKQLMERFHTATRSLHQSLPAEAMLQYVLHLTHLTSAMLQNLAARWIYGWKNRIQVLPHALPGSPSSVGLFSELQYVPPTSVLLAATKLLDEYTYFMGGTVHPTSIKSFWLAGTSLSTNMLDEMRVFGRPLVQYFKWCPLLNQSTLYQGSPAMDYSLVSCAVLESPVHVDLVDLYSSACLWLDRIAKNNKRQQQLATLQLYYQHFIVSNSSTHFRKFAADTSLLNPPELMSRIAIDSNDSDDVNQFYSTPPPSFSQNLSADNWIVFVQRVLQKIGQTIIEYSRGDQNARGGRPMQARTIAEFEAALADFDGNPLAVFLQTFWSAVSSSCKFSATAKSWEQTITQIALPGPGSFPVWEGSIVRNFTFQSRRRFPASPQDDAWNAALHQAKQSIFSGQKLCILQINVDPKSSKLFYKNRKLSQLE